MIRFWEILTFKVSRKSLNTDTTPQWFCIFLPRGGLFYFVYMITSGLTGTLLELLRAGEVVWFLFVLAKSKSRPELRANSHQGISQSSELWFGEMYSWLLLHLYIGTALSISFPILSIVSLVYLVIKHAVDAYRLADARSKSLLTKVDLSFHLSAMSFVIGSSVLLQFYNLLYIALNSHELNMTSMVMGLLTFASLLLHLVQVASWWTWPIQMFSFESKYGRHSDTTVSATTQTFWPPFHPGGQSVL